MSTKSEKTILTETTECPQEWRPNFYLEKLTGLKVTQDGYAILGILDGGIVVRARSKDIRNAQIAFLSKNLLRMRLALMDEQNGRCAICKGATPLQLDHIEPRSRGRNDRKENLRLLCVPCHAGRHGG